MKYKGQMYCTAKQDSVLSGKTPSTHSIEKVWAKRLRLLFDEVVLFEQSIKTGPG
jgi:hypothetical protein